MGYGDQLLITGWAKANDKVLNFTPHYPLFQGNPRFAPHGEPMRYGEWHTKHGYNLTTQGGRFVYKPFKAEPGEIYFTADDLAFGEKHGGDFILVEPNYKGMVGADNRDWGWNHWAELAKRVPLVQMSGKRQLDVPQIDTPSFRHAAAVLARSRGIVTTNGGLHHAAAAVGVPAIVIWGCYNDPAMLGYDSHVNFWIDDRECEGQAKSHKSCRACMNRITVEMVADACSRL